MRICQRRIYLFCEQRRNSFFNKEDHEMKEDIDMFNNIIMLLGLVFVIQTALFCELPIDRDLPPLKGEIEDVLKRFHRWVKRTTAKIETHS